MSATAVFQGPRPNPGLLLLGLLFLPAAIAITIGERGWRDPRAREMGQEPQGWGGELLDTSHTVLACQLCFTVYLPSEKEVMLHQGWRKGPEVPLTDDEVTHHHLLTPLSLLPLCPQLVPKKAMEVFTVCVWRTSPLGSMLSVSPPWRWSRQDATVQFPSSCESCPHPQACPLRCLFLSVSSLLPTKALKVVFLPFPLTEPLWRMGGKFAWTSKHPYIRK